MSALRVSAMLWSLDNTYFGAFMCILPCESTACSNYENMKGILNSASRMRENRRLRLRSGKPNTSVTCCAGVRHRVQHAIHTAQI